MEINGYYVYFLLLTELEKVAKAGDYCRVPGTQDINYCAEVCCPFQPGCCLCSSLESAGIPCKKPDNPTTGTNATAVTSAPQGDNKDNDNWFIGIIILLSVVAACLIIISIVLIFKKCQRKRPVEPLGVRQPRAPIA